MPIEVKGLVWVGTRTPAFRETVEFFRDVLGVSLIEPSADFAWGSMPDGSQVEVFGPDDHDHLSFTTGPVPEFLVDDLLVAIDELRAAPDRDPGGAGHPGGRGLAPFPRTRRKRRRAD